MYSFVVYQVVRFSPETPAISSGNCEAKSTSASKRKSDEKKRHNSDEKKRRRMAFEEKRRLIAVVHQKPKVEAPKATPKPAPIMTQAVAEEKVADGVCTSFLKRLYL